MICQKLPSFAATQPGVRIMNGRFTAIEQAVVIPQGRFEDLVYLHGLVEDAKASVFFADALVKNHHKGAFVGTAAH